MNILEVQQTGGFPLETDTLDFMQESYRQLQSLGWISGNYTIISGCNVQGNFVTDGFVFLAGELMPFKGGQISQYVVVVQETENRDFENGQNKLVFRKRYATFGDAWTKYPWSNFARPQSTKELTAGLAAVNSVPVGLISMWAGATNQIPAGWALCDGSNGTPNLSGKFIVGYQSDKSDYNAIGKTGGAEVVTLQENQMPVHNHPGTAQSAGNHSHTYQKGKTGRGFETKADDYPLITFETVNTSSSGAHTHDVSTENKGGGQSHENRPPFYTLAYIQFKGN